MNIMNKSIDTKNPNTPRERSVNQRKYSFTLYCIAHDVIEPVKTMIADNTITIGVGPAGTGKTYLAVAKEVTE